MVKCAHCDANYDKQFFFSDFLTFMINIYMRVYNTQSCCILVILVYNIIARVFYDKKIILNGLLFVVYIGHFTLFIVDSVAFQRVQSIFN